MLCAKAHLDCDNALTVAMVLQKPNDGLRLGDCLCSCSPLALLLLGDFRHQEESSAFFVSSSLRMGMGHEDKL